MKAHWDTRYTATEGAYGRLPNPFWAEELVRCRGKNALLPCEGEGRNALWAAKQGWSVDAFDSSSVGMATCERWCKAAGVEKLVKTHVADAFEFRKGLPKGYDVVGLFYAHMPEAQRRLFHRKAMSWLKPGGKLILEGFNSRQLGLTSGGPKDATMLFNEAILQDDFDGLIIEQLETIQTTLDEGPFHQGEAEIIRMVGSSPQA